MEDLQVVFLNIYFIRVINFSGRVTAIRRQIVGQIL